MSEAAGRHDTVLILDFGSQVTQLIARRVREAHVYCEVHPCDIDEATIRRLAPRGVILSGSHQSAYEESTDRAPQAVFELGVPVLGICYGMQTMAQQLGGRVEGGTVREFGHAEVRARGHTRLLDGIEDSRNAEGHGLLQVWMSHGDKVTELPPGFRLMASTASCPIAGMADEARGFYGLQFHPEVTHTRQGARILQRFVLDICGCRADWVMHDYIAEACATIQAQVGEDEVILGLSGGVDSSVAAALIHRAIGDRLTCIFVDTGLLRLGEGDQVMETLGRHLGVRVIRVDAGPRFLGALAGEADPEAKRKIIGREFVHVFQEEAAKLSRAKWLAQGTIYPDVIESAGAKTKKATTIKSHHNVGGLPETLHLKLLEPLRELFKDEVRELGLALGLPRDDRVGDRGRGPWDGLARLAAPGVVRPARGQGIVDRRCLERHQDRGRRHDRPGPLDAGHARHPGARRAGRRFAAYRTHPGWGCSGSPGSRRSRTRALPPRLRRSRRSRSRRVDSRGFPMPSAARAWCSTASRSNSSMRRARLSGPCAT